MHPTTDPSFTLTEQTLPRGGHSVYWSHPSLYRAIGRMLG